MWCHGHPISVYSRPISNWKPIVESAGKIKLCGKTSTHFKYIAIKMVSYPSRNTIVLNFMNNSIHIFKLNNYSKISFIFLVVFFM